MTSSGESAAVYCDESPWVGQTWIGPMFPFLGTHLGSLFAKYGAFSST